MSVNAFTRSVPSYNGYQSVECVLSGDYSATAMYDCVVAWKWKAVDVVKLLPT